MNIDKLMAVPTLLYGNETWVPTQEDFIKRQSAEINILRRVKRMFKIR